MRSGKAVLIDGYQRQEGLLELAGGTLNFYKKKSAAGAAAMFGLIGYMFAKKKELVMSVPLADIASVGPDQNGNPSLLFVQTPQGWLQFQVDSYSAWHSAFYPQQAIAGQQPPA